MKYFLIFSLLLSLNAWGKCSKKEIEEQVAKGCQQLDKLGDKYQDYFTTLENIRYCGDLYLWVQSVDDKNNPPQVYVLAHGPQPMLKAKKDRWPFEVKGVKLFQELDKAAKAPAGPASWTEYNWFKNKDDKEATPKMSYLLRCTKNKDIAVGSGAWKGDLES